MTMTSFRRCICLVAAALVAPLVLFGFVTQDPKPLPDPDGKPANMRKPVQVFILMGQSNMLGFGKIGAAGQAGSLKHAVEEKGKYPYLVDDAGNWTVRQDVRNVRVMGSGTGAMKRFNNEWMTIGSGKVGPEIGIGHHLGDAIDAPVLILKSCIGNRSLGWDLLPPGSKRFEKDGMVYAGYKDSPDKWKKGETPKPINWYAGMQYDGDVANAKTVLAELGKHYPGAKKFEVAGFFWWQGDKDRYNAVHAGRYEQNLVRLIEQLRKDFDAPDAKFVCATLGQTAKGAGGAEGQILEAQLAVDGRTGKYKQFKGNVATVYSKPLCHGGASNGHYGGNAETYMDVGEAMGRAMVELLGAKKVSFKNLRPYLDDLTNPAYRALKKKDYVDAYSQLMGLEIALAGPGEGIDEEAAENRRVAFAVMEAELRGILEPAISEISALREAGDIYSLSLIVPKAQRQFAGISVYDSAAGDIAEVLKSPAGRADVALGKKFHRYIERLAKAEERLTLPRSEKSYRSMEEYLEKMAQENPESIYGKAAEIAAYRLGDLFKPISEPLEYVRAATEASR